MTRDVVSQATLAPVSAAHPTTELDPAEAGPKILVVDDEADILKVLTLQLQSKGYRVVTANEGSQAISAMREEQPELILMDIDFPPDVPHGGGIHWNGFVLSQWLRNVNGANRIPIILISANGRDEYKTQASTSGAFAFLSKPIDSFLLFLTVDNALQAKAAGRLC